MAKYLDLSGLEYFWGKIKTHVAAAIASGQFVSFGAQNLTDAQKLQAMTNIGGNMTGYNLVDNGWFLINQRGAADPSARFDYPADRWFIQNAGAVYHLNTYSGITVTLNEGTSYSRLRCRTPDVHLRRAMGKPITMSINYSGTLRTYTSTIPSSVPAETTTILDFYIKDGATNLARMHIDWATDGFFDTYITFYEQSSSIRAVKVEIGPISTLKYDTVPAYADELLRCQRYYTRVHPSATNSPLGMGCAVSASVIRILVPTPVWMYGTPTVYFSNIGNMKLVGNGQSITPTNAEYNAVTRNGVVVSFTVSGATANQTYVLSEGSSSMLLAFGTDNL